MYCEGGRTTPANPEHFAKKIASAVDKCEPHRQKKTKQAERKKK